MASLGGSTSGMDAVVALSRLNSRAQTVRMPAGKLDRIHACLSDGAPERVQRLLDSAHVRATRTARAGGKNGASDTTAAQLYTADVIASLAAEGILDPADTRIAAGALAEACEIPLAAASFDLFLRTTTSAV